MSSMYAANHLKVVIALIAMTKYRRIALIVSHISFNLLILVMFRHEHTLNLTALYRSVTPVYIDNHNGHLITATDAVHHLRDKRFLFSNDLVIVIQGDLIAIIGITNTCCILLVE